MPHQDTALLIKTTLEHHKTALHWWQCGLENAGTVEGYERVEACQDGTLPQEITVSPDIDFSIQESIQIHERDLGRASKYKSNVLYSVLVLKSIWGVTSQNTEELS
jgi:hypothetical protein